MNCSSNLMNTSSLLISSSLALVSLLCSHFQKLKLDKEIVIGVLRV